MAMPALEIRRWTAAEVRQLTADNPLLTPRYWIVDPDARLFERWRPGDDRPEICIGAFTWQAPDDVPAFTLDVEQFFADVFRAEMA